MKKHVLTFSFILLGIAGLKAQTWDTLNATFNQTIHAMIEFDSKLFFGGNFTKINGQNSYFSANLDGTTMNRHTQDQIGGSGFNCFGIHKNKLYGGGTTTVGSGGFNPAMALEWDGSEWGNSSLRVNSNVYAIAGFGNDLIVGGNFGNYVQRHDGTMYHDMGNGFNAPVGSLVVLNNTLYASGGFTASGATNIKHIAKWDGSNWISIGNTNDILSDMVVFDNAIFVLRSSGVNTFLSKWNGSAWTDVPGNFTLGINNYFTIISHVSGIYIGGDFSKVGSVDVNNVVFCSGFSYGALGTSASGITSRVSAMEIYNNYLYVAIQSFENNSIKRYKFPQSNTGIKQVKTAQTMNAYPNPTTGTLSIDLPSLAGASFTITDITGNSVAKNTAINGNDLDVSGLSKGIYFLTITEGENTYNTKFIRQ